MLLFSGFALQAHTQQRELTEIDKCLKDCNCDCAQRFYNVYKKLSGRTNKDVERRIAECSGKESMPNDYWVDLGLPSGILWAKCNVGATKPEEYGDYYAWGETEPKSYYNWSRYRYASVDDNGNLEDLNKYGNYDLKTILDYSDDAATTNLSKAARTPTQAEWLELLLNTTYEWTMVNGVFGRKFTSEKNGNSIFLPAAGERTDSELYYAGERGEYWLLSIVRDEDKKAETYEFSSYNGGGCMCTQSRCCGLPVRAVRSKVINDIR